MTTQQKQYIEQIVGYIRKYAPQFNIKVYSPIIAQAIIESNWGTSNKVINKGVYTHNYFGLKWRNNRCAVSNEYFEEWTSEQRPDGSRYDKVDKFCKFKSMEDCVLGYFQWLDNSSRYDNLKGVTDPKIYVENLKKDGYATDISYISTLLNKINEYDLTKYDPKEVNTMPNEAIICLDPGHAGKYNRCPNNPNYYESEVMWKFHLLKKKYLEQLGVKVITTKSNASQDPALQDRGKKAQGCIAFFSEHSNAVGNGMNEDIDYVAVYYLVDDTTTECDDFSEEIAKKLAPVIAEVMGTKQGYKILTRKSSNDRNGDGIMNDNYYGVLNGARSVGVAGLILEHSFHTNTRTVNWLLNDANLDKLARAEAECIASTVLKKNVSLGGNTSTKPTTSNTSTSSKKYYRVQAGAFSSKVRAENHLNKIKAKGFKDVILVLSGSLYKIQCGAFEDRNRALARRAELQKAGFEACITTVGGTAVSTSTPKKSVEQIAKEVIQGKWGNGATRKNKLTQAGYDYNTVQAKVEELLKK